MDEDIGKMIQEEYDIRLAYKNGIIEGISRYAWWEDGIQYVGTFKKKLEDAIQDIEKEFECI